MLSLTSGAPHCFELEVKRWRVDQACLTNQAGSTSQFRQGMPGWLAALYLGLFCVAFQQVGSQ